jgi:hypothetical protein
MKRLLVTVFVCALVLAAHAAADMPQLLSYQGVLTDASGQAVADGSYSITFRLYTAPSGGSPVWEETSAAVQVAKGIFNATLGTTVGLAGLAFDEPYYVGISVEGEAEFSPRQLLTAVPYSLNAKAVMGTENEFPSSGNVGIGTTGPNVPLVVRANSSQVGIRVDGNDASWASLYVNALQAGSRPGYGYMRQSILEAYSFLDPGDIWHMRMGNSNYAINASMAGNVSIGALNPSTERLLVDGGIQLGNTAGTNAGTLRWSGADFEGYDGSSWKSLTATGGGSLPAGTTGQTLWHNGSDWAATSSLYNSGTQIGIGTTTPGAHLDVVGTSNQDIKVETSSSTGKASLVLKSTGGSFDYLELDKYAPSAGGSTGGTIPLANLSRIAAGTLAGPLMLQVTSANPMYFVTSNLERMRLDAGGNLGIGTTSPEAKLHVGGGQWDLTNTEGDFKIGDSTFRLKFGMATGGGGAGSAGIRVAGGAEKLFLGGGAAEVLSVDGEGNTNIGGATSNAKLHLFRSGVDSAMVNATTYSNGGKIELCDEAGNEMFAFEPDVDGTGGYMRIRRSAASTGIAVDGNYLNSNEPRLSISGSTQGAYFRMDQSGDGSVALPAGAISSAEILDEPGAASYAEASPSAVTISVGSYTTIASRSITVPAAGYVLVIATGQAQAAHTTEAASSCNFGVSDAATSLPINQDVAFVIPSAAASGAYHVPATVHGLFSVAGAGTYTYYFLGYGILGFMYCFDAQLTLIYIPTAYGTVVPTVAGAGPSAEDGGTRPGLTAAEIASERARSEADNAARIEKELAEMRARIEDLEREALNKK